ncbi:DUF4367 domain-containing protein [Candidatus Merdisoma sp. JLR.KK006]|uniref:DUF4367 domain-containing protein n=1 Tax=Candidatus Merdisoma sp. JLR.KK006 TaxID=3112626 RepID=UPI002FF42747
MTEKKNENLIRELYKEMEEELEKAPEVMDTYKIKYINLLIAKLEGREELPPDMEPERFLERFNERFGLDLSLEPSDSETAVKRAKKASRISWKGRIAVTAAIIVVMAGIGNTASVMAVDKSLWQIIRETTHGVYFHTMGSRENVMEEGVSEYYKIYSDWESLKESLERRVLVPEYIPDGLVLELIEKNIFENSEEIMAYYQNGDIQLNISCEYYIINGDIFKNKGGNEVLGQQRQIGDRNVYISTEDDINIIFAEDDIIYTIDTNLDLSEAEKIVENLK